jgi:indole-3-glycerol phosphate synthase
MPTQLEQILAHTLLELKGRKETADYSVLERKAAEHTPRGFAARLRAVAVDRPAVIAELKKASPSKGLIRPDFYPEKLAPALEASGAAALSVLTNQEFFQGSLSYLETASAAVKIPCLRKDFMIDPFQVLEARASGADAILLIVAALSNESLAELRVEAHNLGLDVLCEVHDRREMERAIGLGFELIGVNSRDLRTFEMHPELLFELAVLMPSNIVTVAESGIRSAEEIQKLRAAGYDAFLIGETLMRQPDPSAALATLLDREYSVEK